jgi:hypothetical protein
MKKVAMFIVMLLAVACSTVKIPMEKTTVYVKSDIPEKHKLVSDKTVTFFESQGVNSMQEFWPSVMFKAPGLKNAGFDFNVENTDLNWAMSRPPEGAFDTVELTDSIATPAYTAIVWKVGSKHPAYSDYEPEFKFTSVRVKRDSLYITAENMSDFKDSITPQFIAQKLSELEFTVQPKN